MTHFHQENSQARQTTPGADVYYVTAGFWVTQNNSEGKLHVSIIDCKQFNAEHRLDGHR